MPEPVAEVSTSSHGMMPAEVVVPLVAKTSVAPPVGVGAVAKMMLVLVVPGAAVPRLVPRIKAVGAVVGAVPLATTVRTRVAFVPVALLISTLAPLLIKVMTLNAPPKVRALFVPRLSLTAVVLLPLMTQVPPLRMTGWEA